ncbi:hypothetical protein VTK73DRAFT_9779 [Phialemonium thermophilum]|uniref:Uncharacterized protein n=1 Tax=Phialemonium thermophilum TaxID=223376 RepID=A0ABR3W0J9_9PEZI
MLLAWDPRLEAHIPNHMPARTGMTTASFVAYIVFSVLSLPVIYIRPHKLQRFFYVASSVTIVFFLVLLIWALATMGPAGFGDTITAPAGTASSGPASLGWLMMYGILATVGSIAAGILNQNDYARFAARPRHALVGQAAAFPVYGILCSVVGILVTAATQNRFGGDALWNPADLFARLVNDHPHSSRTRAASFFAALALCVSQIGVNVPGNALSGGFDLAATFPRFVNIRRGAYLTAVLSVVVNPWQLVNTATTFLTVLSSYSIFLGPMTGLMVVSYLVVNRRKINVDDLYRGDASSIYWFSYGLNWRAPVAWTVGFAPLMPGFIAAVSPSAKVSAGATEFYYLSYLYGFTASGLVYVLLHRLFPAPRLDAYVRGSQSPQELQALFRQKWDSISYDGDSVIEGAEKEQAGEVVDGETKAHEV